jgi:5-methyltetrahydrofolate--homocysteine methyltransferase
MAQPNAGQPVLEGAKVVYRETPQEMAARIPTLLNAGVSIVGACCGSTPDHIEAIHRAVRLA